MTTVGEVALIVINFLTYPTWHLVVFFIIIFIIIIYSMLKDWGFV
ncbi:MAG: hypothetical protein WCK10_00465 [Candidatus Staskawiczbacteria bacterium]